jgi:hypothetical protein
MRGFEHWPDGNCRPVNGHQSRLDSMNTQNKIAAEIIREAGRRSHIVLQGWHYALVNPALLGPVGILPAY